MHYRRISEFEFDNVPHAEPLCAILDIEDRVVTGSTYDFRAFKLWNDVVDIAVIRSAYRQQCAPAVAPVDIVRSLAKCVDTELADRMRRFGLDFDDLCLKSENVVMQDIHFLPAVVHTQIFQRSGENGGSDPQHIDTRRHFLIEHGHQA